MKIYDITVPISPSIPVWPGDPPVDLHRVSKIEEGDNANVSHLSAGVHVGTHVDAPYHFIASGIPLDQVPLDWFVGPAFVVEVPDVGLITAQDIQHVRIPAGTQRVLFKTRNSALWTEGENEFFEDFVALSPDAAQLLVKMGIKLVGIDYLSIAPYKQSRPVHEILLGAEVAVLEGVNLSDVTPGAYTLYCLPLKLVGVDGAPARAILIEK